MTSSTGMDQPDPRAHRYLVMVRVMVTPGYTVTSPGRTGRQTSRSRRTWTCTQGRRAPRTSWSVAGWACAGASACSCWSRSSGGTYAAQPANNKHKKQNLFQKHNVKKLASGKRAFIVFFYSRTSFSKYSKLDFLSRAIWGMSLKNLKLHQR